MTLQRRQLFIYWRVAAADAGAAQQAARALQRSLRERMPGLRAALFRRDGDDDEAPATLMETYALAATQAGDGIGEALQRLIVDEGDRALRGWLCSARHVEAFEAVEG